MRDNKRREKEETKKCKKYDKIYKNDEVISIKTLFVTLGHVMR